MEQTLTAVSVLSAVFVSLFSTELLLTWGDPAA